MNKEFTVETLEKLFGNFSIDFNLLWIALVFGIITDFITGIAKAYKSDGKICSSKLRDGGFKKCGIIFVCIMSLGLSEFFSDTYFIISNSVLCYYVYTELISVTENLSALGVPLPPIFKKLLGKKKDE